MLHTQLELIQQTNSAVLDKLSSREQLQVAKDCIEIGDILMYDEEDFVQAIEVLQKALKVQQNILGKHHTQVGCTCSLIGTAYWLQNKNKNNNNITVGSQLLRDALRYFLEGRRIYFKNYEESRTKGADNRIASILNQLGHHVDEIKKIQFIIERIGNHELQSDMWKLKGFPNKAKKELNKARSCSMTLMNLIG